MASDYRFEALARRDSDETTPLLSLNAWDFYLARTSEMRIIFCGDSPTVSTGFSIITREICGYLHSLGHEVIVLGLSYFGEPHSYPYPIYPCVDPLRKFRDPWGVMRLPHLMREIKPDIVILLNDPWNLKEYFESIRRYESSHGVVLDQIPIVGYLAVDSLNTSARDFSFLPDYPRDWNSLYLSHLITWTEFGRDELIRGGWRGPCSIIPLGVDSGIFYPCDRLESRSMLGLDTEKTRDKFIVGVIGRNQTRKRLDLAIKFFAEWINRCSISDSILFIHSAPSGENSTDIKSLVRYYGLQPGRVLLSEPEIGNGIDLSLLRALYNSLDVLISASQAEGWNLPALEAMACGTPVILGDSGGHDWARGAAVMVECSSTAMTAPMNGAMCTIGSVPDREDFIEAINLIYTDSSFRRNRIEHGLELARELNWKSTCEKFAAVLDEVIGRASQ